jgi:hypothetical protein
LHNARRRSQKRIRKGFLRMFGNLLACHVRKSLALGSSVCWESVCRWVVVGVLGVLGPWGEGAVAVLCRGQRLWASRCSDIGVGALVVVGSGKMIGRPGLSFITFKGGSQALLCKWTCLLRQLSCIEWVHTFDNDAGWSAVWVWVWVLVIDTLVVSGGDRGRGGKWRNE